MVGLGLLDYFRMRDKIGSAAIRVVCQDLTLAWGIILVVLNLRVDVWIAAAGRCSLTQVHQLIPMWVVPALTLALLLWSVLFLALTRPARSTTPH
jgi:hypothetical protein